MSTLTLSREAQGLSGDPRLSMLTRDAQLDVCSGSEGCGRREELSPLRFLYNASVPGRGSTTLFKVMLTNSCSSDCVYCVNQSGLDVPRSEYQPDELARTFMELDRKRLAQGLFLTSGIANSPSATMERMLSTVEILRRRYRYRGYVHLKVLPGAAFGCVEAACKLADRVSINMEAPTADHLARLSVRKDLHHGILDRMEWIKRVLDSGTGAARAGQTTQFVVGAAGESDLDLLRTTSHLYRSVGLRRAYFSAFRPVPGSSLEDAAPTPPIREFRLYQADWLLRVYGFRPDEVELALDEEGLLPLGSDPKQTVATRQPWLFPLDVNSAGYDELLRVPGIGPGSARNIVEARRDHSICSMQQLKKMRVVTGRAGPFIRFQGMTGLERQLHMGLGA